MPLKPPVIDNRRYQDLVDEALARVAVHSPEWTQLGSNCLPRLYGSLSRLL